MLDSSNKTWTVYRHLLPTQETYIGITSGCVTDRWKNGFGYESQRKFFKRIVSIGWDNICHEILAEGLSEIDARKMERDLIIKEVLRNKDRCLNTADANVKQNISVSFRDSDDPVRSYTKFIVYWNDSWLDRYINLLGRHPAGGRLYDDRLELCFYELSNDIWHECIYTIPIAESIVTYDQLRTYLSSEVCGRWVDRQESSSRGGA